MFQSGRIPLWLKLFDHPEHLNKMVVQYLIPNQFIEKFKERGKPTTLAFLVGHKDGDLITVSHLIIPTQNEFRTDVDRGNK